MTNINYQNEQRLLNIPQAAKILQIAPHTLRVWLSQNRVIPKYLVIKLGNRTLILREKFLMWIEDGCKFE